MFAKFFKAPTYSGGTWSTFSDDRLFVTDSIESYEYTKRFTDIGTFTMTLPFFADILKKLVLNGTIYFDHDWLWVQSLQYDGQKITISGTDCKGFLGTRVSLYGTAAQSGAEGYDVVSGTTAECMAHYIDNNCINCVLPGGQTADTARMLPLVWSGGAAGLANDSYMARLEYVSDIVNRLCEHAGIGYDVRGILKNRCFGVTTIQGIDRGTGQSVRPRTIFSAAHCNVISQNFEHGVDNLYNIVYAEDINSTVKPVARGSESTGVSRRECTVNAGISSTDPETSTCFDRFVLNEVADNLESHSFMIDAASVSGYGTNYNIGDIVAVQDDYTKNLTNMQITEVTKSYSHGRQSLSLTFGTPKQKPFQKIVNNFLNGTARRR